MTSWRGAVLGLCGVIALGCSGGCSGGGGSGGGSGGGGGGGGAANFPLHLAGDVLEDDSGNPFLLSGDAAWSLMVELSDAEVDTYLDDRRQKGFNAVLVNLIERGFGGPQLPANQAGEEPFEPADDFDAPNDAYFAHADRVIDAAAARGILVLLTPAYLGFNCGDQGWCQQMLDESEATMRNYGRYLGDRYRNKGNVLWVHGGDVDAADYSGALARVNAIAEGIRERAPAHLFTAHCSRGNSALDCYDEPWLDLNSTYSECGAENTLAQVRIDYARPGPVPFFYIEGRYENESGTSLGCLIDQFAWSVLGGAGGHVFGNNPVWLFDSGWETASGIGSAGSQAMARVAALFRSRAWHLLLPDVNDEVLVAASGSGAVAGRASDGQTIVVYTPSAQSLSVDLDKLSGNEARIWWFNPTNGDLSEDVNSPLGSNGVVAFPAPGRRLLVLDDAAKNLPPPG
jgi:hypothetical protein